MIALLLIPVEVRLLFYFSLRYIYLACFVYRRGLGIRYSFAVAHPAWRGLAAAHERADASSGLRRLG